MSRDRDAYGQALLQAHRATPVTSSARGQGCYTLAMVPLTACLWLAAAPATASTSTAPAAAASPAAASDGLDAEAAALGEAALAARGLEARLRVLADQVALPLKRLPGDHRDQRFAVVSLTEVGPEAQQRKLGVVVADALLTSLARDHHLPLVERRALAALLDEQALGQSGALDEATAAQVGKLAGARALVVGSVADAGDEFVVTVRAVDAESAALVAGSAHKARLPKGELLALSADAVVLKSKGDALVRSALLPGWGQAYNGEGVKAVLVAGGVGTLAFSTLSAAALGGWVRFGLYPALGSRPEDKDLSADALQARVVETRQLGDGLLWTAGVLGALTAVSWGAGAVDAYLSGTDVGSLDAALADR